MSGLGETFQIALKVASAFEASGVDYFLGGSVASSLQGQPRFTRDIDFVVQLVPARVPALVAALGPEFDVDDVALTKAARDLGSWNIFHIATATRIDLFVLRTSEFDAEEFSRRQRIELEPDKSLMVKTPEDSALRKLLWYREGGEASSQQFRDVVDILRVQQGRLDAGYLDRWATRLGLGELLSRARSASG